MNGDSPCAAAHTSCNELSVTYAFFRHKPRPVDTNGKLISREQTGDHPGNERLGQSHQTAPQTLQRCHYKAREAVKNHCQETRPRSGLMRLLRRCPDTARQLPRANLRHLRVCLKRTLKKAEGVSGLKQRCAAKSHTLISMQDLTGVAAQCGRALGGPAKLVGPPIPSHRGDRQRVISVSAQLQGGQRAHQIQGAIEESIGTPRCRAKSEN